MEEKDLTAWWLSEISGGTVVFPPVKVSFLPNFVVKKKSANANFGFGFELLKEEAVRNVNRAINRWLYEEES